MLGESRGGDTKLHILAERTHFLSEEKKLQLAISMSICASKIIRH